MTPALAERHQNSFISTAQLVFPCGPSSKTATFQPWSEYRTMRFRLIKVLGEAVQTSTEIPSGGLKFEL